MSKSAIKKLVIKHIQRVSLGEIQQSGKSKIQSILTTIKPDKNYKLPMQEYLKSSLLTTREKQLAFALRSGSYNLKVNYKSRFDKDMKCRNSYI